MTPLAHVERFGDALRTIGTFLKLARHDSWSRQRLARHQHLGLGRLLRYAEKHSKFYQKLYQPLDLGPNVSLQSLPIVTKAMVMENFDDVVTDPRLKLLELQHHLAHAQGDALYHREYRALRTSGTTGEPGIFVYDRCAWACVLADTLRWQRMIGVSPRFPSRIRIATIGAQHPGHVSYRLTASGSFGLYKLLTLDATSKIETLVSALNEFRPQVLLPYPSVAALLAREALAGRLQARPKIVSTHSEVLTPDMAAVIDQAWGAPPFDHYGLSEHPNCGSACKYRKGLHLFEDFFIAEVVDEDNRPVAPGSPGFKLLLTNLYNFAQPLIRYEVSDILTLDPGTCPCGRPFRLVKKIGGRNDDIIYLLGEDGRERPVHPLHFYDAMESLKDIRQYQVIQEENGLQIRLVPEADADRRQLEAAVRAQLAASLRPLGLGNIMLKLTFLDAIARTPEKMGKVKLIKATR